SNPVLSGITGLRSGTLKSGRLGNDFNIAGNPALSACEVLALKTTLNALSDHSGANNGCSVACTASSPVCAGTLGGTANQPGTFTGDAVVNNQADLDWLKNVVNLTGSLHIDNTALTAVVGLQNLDSIGADFTMINNPNISNVNGLSGLHKGAGSFNIQSNAGLTNINGLASLNRVDGNFQIYSNSNASFASVGGLTGLTMVGGNFNIQSNDALTNLDGLANLTTIGKNFQVYSNAKLASMLSVVKPAGKFSTFTGTITVQYNTLLSICQAEAAKTAMPGYTSYSQTSNLACASPKTCAAGVCQ
ncbi:MAG TPA: hypothetical protein VGC79_17345, partial [Polyangiaceae bacterium]